MEKNILRNMELYQEGTFNGHNHLSKFKSVLITYSKPHIAMPNLEMYKISYYSLLRAPKILSETC